ncbi:MAG TPA: hypothetical protein PKW12_12980 [Verrucomicrobiota bacterium]|nr:hypothetical protein [Verrucomicrobiota bacterium]
MNSSRPKPMGAPVNASQEAAAAPEWWTALPAGERQFLRRLARLVRAARRSRAPEVARAAAKWERALACFIKVRLRHERRGGGRAH